MLGKWTEIIIMALLIRITFDSSRQSRLIIFVIYGHTKKIHKIGCFSNIRKQADAAFWYVANGAGRPADVRFEKQQQRNGSFCSCIACLIIFKWSVYFILWGVAGFCSRLSLSLLLAVCFLIKCNTQLFYTHILARVCSFFVRSLTNQIIEFVHSRSSFARFLCQHSARWFISLFHRATKRD